MKPSIPVSSLPLSPSSSIAGALLAALVAAGCARATPSPAPAPSPTASAATAVPAPAAPSTVDTRRAALAALLDEHWQWRMKTWPEWASIIGDLRYNDRWSDYSLDEQQRQIADSQAFLARFQALDVRGLTDQEQLDQRLSVFELEDILAEARFEPWLMPFNHFRGFHLDTGQVVAVLRFQTVKDYDDYLKRLAALPAMFAQQMTAMRAGLARKVLPPRYSIERAVTEVEKMAAARPADSPFARCVVSFGTDIPAADQARLRAAVLHAVEHDVLPAYARLAAFARTEYAPHGRTEVGVWSLPDGDARYRAAVKHYTTTDATPDELHQLGLAEVARIETASLAIARKLGFKDLKTFRARVRNNPRLRATTGADLLARYQRYTDQMYQRLPALFGRLPVQKMVVVPMEAFRSVGSTSAEYNVGAADGSRPGRVLVNVTDIKRRSLLDVETTAYHEGVPGHHLQLTIAQEMKDLPPFRQHGYYGAYIEGWGLYSEHLGAEVGFFQDPYSEYGHVQAEMQRAIRLVVDTGLHARKWSRQQVVQYFHDHSNLDEPTVQNETDRYIVFPGQALGYKVGQLTILRLRDKATQALGARFDVRAFHDEILGGGAMPLGVLEERIDAWIARQPR